MTIDLILVPKSDRLLQTMMQRHYSQPKGFVGRQLIYRISVIQHIYGFIVGGSATLFLPGRHAFFAGNIPPLSHIVNNTFFHVEKQENRRYPLRNFTTQIIQAWRSRVISDWPYYYGDSVIAFESLVELPRTGELYRKDHWTEVGITKGFTCKREAGISTDAWSGRRVWGVGSPKRVFMRKIEPR